MEPEREVLDESQRRGGAAHEGAGKTAEPLRTIYRCESDGCTFESQKWRGQCPDCEQWGTVKEHEEVDAPLTARVAHNRSWNIDAGSAPRRLVECGTEDFTRISTGIGEFDRVLGETADSHGLVPGSVVLLSGDPGSGLPRVLDPRTGALGPYAPGQEVTALNEATFDMVACSTQTDPRLDAESVVAITGLGRELRLSPRQQFLSIDGWVDAADVVPGTGIAAPRCMPFFGDRPLLDHEVKILAYMLSDGCTRNGCPCVTAELKSVADDLFEISRLFNMGLTVSGPANNRAKTFRFAVHSHHRLASRLAVGEALARARKDAGLTVPQWAKASGLNSAMLWQWCSGDSSPSQAQLAALADAAGVHVATLCPDLARVASKENQMTAFLKSHGVWDKKAAQKRVPPCVFCLPKEQVALFLRVLFTCDGSVYLKNRGTVPMLSYSTISRGLAEDVQHLLLRFGFVTRIRTKPMPRVREGYVAYEITMAGVSEMQRFIREVGVMKNESATETILAMAEPDAASTHRDTVPTSPAFWRRLRAYMGGDGVVNVRKKAGVRLHPVRQDRPLTRRLVQALAETYPSQELDRLAYGDVYWDEVVEVRTGGPIEFHQAHGDGIDNWVAGDVFIRSPR